MNPQRELLMSELWKRLYSVSGVQRVVRNPSEPSGVDNMPCIHIIEFEDEVTDRDMRGSTVIQQRRELTVAVDTFISGSSDGAASQELATFVIACKQAIFDGGPTLGGLCSIGELDASDVIVMEGPDSIRGLRTRFEIHYTEEIT